MQTIWKRFHHAYSSRGSWVALLSVLTILLFAPAANAVIVNNPPIIVSQMNWVTAFPAGGVLSNATVAGSSWAINSKGVIVTGTTYGNEIIQFSGVGDAATVVGPVAGYYGPGGIAIDSTGNLYVSDEDYSYIVKIPMNADGTYTMAIDPSEPANQPGGATPIPACTGVAKTDATAGECLIPMAGDVNSTALGGTGYGVTSLAFDKSSDLFIATDGMGDTSVNAGVNYSIFECAHACLYTATGATPTLIYQEPISTTVSTTGQLSFGTMAFDPWGNLIFNDDAQESAGTSVSSNVKELVYNSTAKTFSSTATVLATYNDANPATQYDDEIDTVYINPNTGTVYFGLEDSGIFALPNTATGGVNTAALYGVSSQGTKLMLQDSYGNFYFVGSNSANGYTDTLGYISLSGPTFSGAPSATTANVVVADNSAACTPTLSLAFSDGEYSATAGSCSGMSEVLEGGTTADTTGSFVSEAVTFTPSSGSVTVAPTSSLTVTDTTTNDQSVPLTASGSAITGIDQSTWLAPFPSGGDFGASASDGHSLAINSKGVVVAGSSYGASGILEYVPGTAVTSPLTDLAIVGPLGGAGGMAIDSQGFLYASSEYSNTIWKMPMQSDGTYAAFTAAPATIPACAGDSSTTVDQAGICQIVVGGDLFFGIAEMTFDANGNLFITSDGQALGTSTNTYEGYSVLKCGATCLYGATPTDPVLLFAEPAATSTGQIYVGGIAVDTSDNVFFTDSEIAASGSAFSLYSDLNELPVSAGAGYGGATTGYDAAPTVLETLTPACAVVSSPCTYNNEIDAVSVDPKTNNVYFADQYTGIYELVDNGGTYNTAAAIPVASPGAKAIVADGNGNFYFVGYDTGDTLGFDQLGSAVLAGEATAATPTTGTVNVLSSFACDGNPSLALTFADTDFAAPTPTGCGAMALGGGANYSATITYTPSVSATGTVTTVMTATDATNGGSGTANVTATAATAQPVTFSGITSPVVYGSGPYTLSATSVTGNAPVFTIDTTTGTQGIASISGDTLTITGVGTFDVDVNVPGGASGGTTYAAGYLQVPITVTTAPQTITYTGPTTMAYTTTPIALASDATGGASVEPVTFALVSGPATLSGSTLTLTGVGTVSLTADQEGNADYAAATELPISITVTTAGTVVTPTITPASGSLVIGVNNTVTIADTTPGAAIYYTTDGTNPLAVGGTGVLYAAPFALSAGTVTVTAAASLANYTSSAAATEAYTVTAVAPTFAISAAPPAVTLQPGTTATVVLTVAPSASFTSAVTFACSGAPAGVTCSFSPASITLPATTTTTLTITDSASAALHNGPSPFLPGGVTFALALGFLGWKKRRGLFVSFLLLAGILCITQLTACGSSSSSKSTTSTMTVTATGGTVTQTLPVTITVN